MKYFEYNLWIDVNSEIDSKRCAAQKIWEERARLYVEEYSEAKRYLSKAFIKTYEDNFGFRGCYLSGLLLSAKQRKRNDNTNQKEIPACKLLLSDLVDSWQLTYYNLEFFGFQPAGKGILPVFNNGYLTVEFSELLLMKEEKFSHELLFSDGSTLLIHFSRVSAKKIDQP